MRTAFFIPVILKEFIINMKYRYYCGQFDSAVRSFQLTERSKVIGPIMQPSNRPASIGLFSVDPSKS